MNEMRKNVVFLDSFGLTDSLNTRSINDLVRWTNYPSSTPEEAIERSQNADILVTNKVVIDNALLTACPSIKHIAVSATGYDIIDLNACVRHQVSVSNIPSYADTSLAEHVISLALALRRSLIRYRQQVINKQWHTSQSFCLFDKPIQDLKESIFGVIGFGQLGQATAHLAKALGMQVVYYSRTQRPNSVAEYLEFDELIRQADIVSLHCSLTPQTENLIDVSELNAMKNSAILINTARGGIANEQAVAQAVHDGRIAGIGFDVLIEEPPVNDSPLLDIADKSNVIITPHIAWASESAMANLCTILVDNVRAFIGGQPINIVSNSRI